MLDVIFTYINSILDVQFMSYMNSDFIISLNNKLMIENNAIHTYLCEPLGEKIVSDSEHLNIQHILDSSSQLFL